MHSSPTERHSAYFSSRVSLRFEKEKRGQSAERDVGAWATRRARRGGRRSGGGSNGAKDEARSARRARHARAVRLDPGRSMVPAPAGLRDRRRVGARRHARARSRNRVGSRATHPLSTGGATPNAPASAVTTSFFSSSTFICSISAAAASAIVALEVRLGAVRRVVWLTRRAAGRKRKDRVGSEKNHICLLMKTDRASDKVFNFGWISSEDHGILRPFSPGGKPELTSDPGEHGCRRARGRKRPAGFRARRTQV